MPALAMWCTSAAILLKPMNPSIPTMSMRSRQHRAEKRPGVRNQVGAARDHFQEPAGTAAIANGSHVQGNGDALIAIGE